MTDDALIPTIQELRDKAESSSNASVNEEGSMYFDGRFSAFNEVLKLMERAVSIDGEICICDCEDHGNER